MSVDVIIPTYKPDEKLIAIIEKLHTQTVRPGKIILMNTEQKYLENLLRGRKYDELGKYIEVHHISVWEFDHGLTRNLGAGYSEADYLLYMTQDAIPQDNRLIEKMLKAYEDEKVCSVFARQVADDKATLAERFSRGFNYPETSCVKSFEDKKRLGIKTYFCSNACAMYKRDLFLKLGLFPKDMIFNEDMVFAHKVIEGGYKIAYAADAVVIHSHNYTNMQQFRRNFDIGVSQTMHPEVFADVSSEAEGSSYAKSAAVYFKQNKKPFYFVPFAITCAYRLIGFRLGKRYNKLSHRSILKYTMSPVYFKKHWS